MATTAFIVLLHLGALAAPFFFGWSGLVTALVLLWVSGSLGIGIGFHRLLTHRGYRTGKALEYFLTICGMLAWQSGAIWWVSWHRIHHKYSEQDGDPHTPRDGKWWSHMGWLIYDRDQLHDRRILTLYAPELMRDPLHRWLNRLFFLPSLLLTIGLFWAGGWPLLLWGICVPVVLGWHITWLVNSATHLWGQRRFATRDNSRNNWWVALLTFGEGWHNNHHADPVCPRHGLAWYELDINWWTIQALAKLGLVRDVSPARQWRRLRAGQ